MVRLSVGIESVDDLIEDLERALQAVGTGVAVSSSS
jgi:cystathionine beta-lyase/cystathionine gamma-synthase